MSQQQIKEYINKLVRREIKNAIKDEVVRLVAAGVMNEIIDKSFKKTLKELNVGTTVTTKASPDPEMQGLWDLLDEPQEEEQPAPKKAKTKTTATNKTQENDLSEITNKWARLAGIPTTKEDPVRAPTTVAKKEVVQPPKQLTEESQYVPQQKLHGGSNDLNNVVLPEGDVDPSVLLGGGQRQSPYTNPVSSGEILPSGEINEQLIMSFLKK